MRLTQSAAQASTVSRRFALAAANVVRSSDGLDLGESSQHNLNSSLLRSWAVHVREVHLSQHSYSHPGLCAFLEAAGSLDKLHLLCWTLLEAAQAEPIILRCSTVKALFISGFHLPTVLPPLLDHLAIRICDNRMSEEIHWNPQTLAACITRLARSKPLELLTVDFDTSDVPLACPTFLPQLEIAVSFSMDDETTLDLSWLQRQPCPWLKLEIRVQTALPAQLSLLVQQLRLVPTHHLELHMVRGLHQIQPLWEQLPVTDTLCPALPQPRPQLPLRGADQPAPQPQHVDRGPWRQGW